MIWELALDFECPGGLGSQICVLHPQVSKRSSVLPKRLLQCLNRCKLNIDLLYFYLHSFTHRKVGRSQIRFKLEWTIDKVYQFSFFNTETYVNVLIFSWYSRTIAEDIKCHEGLGCFPNKYFERIMIEFLSGSKAIKKDFEVDANVSK